jgi:lanosterol synthase
MGYLYGRRFKAEEDALIRSLRQVRTISRSDSLFFLFTKEGTFQELYTQPYESINWPKQRNNIAKVDVYVRHSFVLDALFHVLSFWVNYVCPKFVLSAGIDAAYSLVCMEDDNTSYQCLGPVNKPMHMICRYDREGADSEAFKLHKEKLRDFMWVGREGMLMTGTNGSQLWDLAFISQALYETGLAEQKAYKTNVVKALEWLDDCQMRENPPHFEKAYRQATKGAWPFSTKEQGYTVSDCSAEALKAVIYLQELE